MLALAAVAVISGLLVARIGTTAARLGCLGLLVAVGLGLGAVALAQRRVWGSPARSVRRLAGRIDPERSGRAVRALSLLGPDGDVRPEQGMSAELARLHVERTLAALPAEAILRRASRVAARVRVVATGIAVAAAFVAVVRGWSVLEGADVLLARHGVAPLSMTWLDDLEVTARPPDYLHLEALRAQPYEEVELPYGTLLTFRGVPRHPGRTLLLTDGNHEIPFVEDGTGAWVARWPLTDSASLRVVARFGGVVIPERKATHIRSRPDQAPIVLLEGAPRQLRIGSSEDTGELSLRYEAVDDHGLREVDLVLRSGGREERRVLARLDGETRHDRGGHVLRTRDPFLRRSHAPIEVRVEAKDNDPLTGPKWGASAAITLVPPDVGEPEAQRLDALRGLRDALVDTLAWRLGRELPADVAGKKTFAAEDKARFDADTERLEAVLTSRHAGLGVPPRLQAMLQGPQRKLRNAVLAETRSPSTGTRAAVVGATERLVLVLDGVIRGLALKSARETARRLADVAEDLAVGASQASTPSNGAPQPAPGNGAAHAPDERTRGLARMDASTLVLQGGARWLSRMGPLGHDLGEIVDADLARVARARALPDWKHAELAARDLAARLHEPDPSFGSRGRPGHAGGESGGGRGIPGEAGDSDEAQQAFDEAAQELEQLVQDHASGIGDVEQALRAGASEEDLRRLRDEAAKHAQAIREAAKPLPSVGGGSDSWTSKGAAAREHAEQMAHSLERGDPADAVQSGRNAMAALEEAKRIAQRQRWFNEPGESEKKIDEARRKLEPELRWAEEQLQAARRRAAERAAKELGKSGEREEKLAERAKKLASEGNDRGSMPEPAIEALEEAERAAREAAQSLKRGDAERGLERQKEAQRKLEMAKEALGGEGQEARELGQDGDEVPPAFDHADIPKADQHKGPEDFRRRVVKGLGQPSGGKLKDAVRRYAEGLLR